MKKNIIFISLIPLILVFSTFCMEERSLTKQEAAKLYTEAASDYRWGNISYQDYRTKMMRAIPLLDEVQDYTINPLVEAVGNNDFEFTQALLDRGASPVFRGMSHMNAFDALRIKTHDVYSNPDAVIAFIELLNAYLKPGEQQTPYSLAGMNENYVKDQDLPTALRHAFGLE